MTGVDWAVHKKLAYGLLHLMPEQFMRLTPAELFDMAEARSEYIQAEQEAELRRTAQLAAWVLSPFAKKALSVGDFIKKPQPAKKKEEILDEYAKMEAEFGLKEGGEHNG